jgi:hypothetical protein
MAVAGEAMTKKNRESNNYWLQRPVDALEIPPTGDVVIREPREGWSLAFYTAVLRQYFVVRGAYPRTARMHPSTVLAIAPTEGVLPESWPILEVRRHYAPARIILSDDESLLPE